MHHPLRCLTLRPAPTTDSPRPTSRAVAFFLSLSDETGTLTLGVSVLRVLDNEMQSHIGNGSGTGRLRMKGTSRLILRLVLITHRTNAKSDPRIYPWLRRIRGLKGWCTMWREKGNDSVYVFLVLVLALALALRNRYRLVGPLDAGR
ncbi:hypothetical protein D9758_007761 [Tetrapyrgos nigripes]|uniref:Uncharacterized protein n=1 Tax=Tetrapyrgos nigripes TaxID=182062 RepID=A0A8H5G575_9AGAR|nr:hypothetical protein D9758_007761 [Tetrapyrgos nigripes]